MGNYLFGTTPEIQTTPAPSFRISEGGTLKMVLLGESCVGKTCLFKQYFENVFKKGYVVSAAMGVDYEHQQITILDREFILQVWDTSRDRWLTMGPLYGNTHVFIVVFDLTCMQTLEYVPKYIENILKSPYASKETVVAVIGNKSDLISKVVVRKSDILCALSRYPQARYYETTAVQHNSVKRVFEDLARAAALGLENDTACHFKEEGKLQQQRDLYKIKSYRDVKITTSQ